MMKKIIICLLITILLIFSACKAKPEVVETEEEITPTEETIETVEEEIIKKGIYVSNNLPGKTFSLKIPEDWSMQEYPEKNIVQFSPPIEEMEGNDAIYTIFVGVFEEFPQTDFSNIKFPKILKNLWSSFEGENYQPSNLGDYEAKRYERTYKHLMSVKEGVDESENKKTALEGGIITEQDKFKYVLSYYYVGNNPKEFEEIVHRVADSFELNVKGESKIDKKKVSENFLNILLLGRDARPNERSVWCRSDINIILHINLNNGSIALISIPRDTRVEIPGHGYTKINSAYALGGPELAIKTFENFTGLKINYYISTDFYGFENLIDKLGGVTVEVDKRLVDPFSGVDLYPGVQTLSGSQALAYSRCRKGPCGGDWGRMNRQRQMLISLAQKFQVIETWIQLPALVNMVLEDRLIGTNIKLLDLIKYSPLFFKINTKNIENFYIPTSSATIDGVYYLVADEELIKDIFAKYK
jgi:LCP family protein required for cell wall assembly